VELHQQLTFSLNDQDRPYVTVHEESQKISFHLFGVAHGFCITLSTAHIPQVEQLLTLLWAMKDEQDQRPVLALVEDKQAA
jgi:hypothetical protein